MLTAPRMVRTERAVRPCFPITLPTSAGATLSSQNGVFVPLHGLHFDGFRLVYQSPRDFADQFIYCHHVNLGHELASDRKHPRRSDLDRCADSISTPLVKSVICVLDSEKSRTHLKMSEKKLGDCGFGCLGRVFVDQLGHNGGQLGSNAAPVGDAVVLQVN